MKKREKIFDILSSDEEDIRPKKKVKKKDNEMKKKAKQNIK